MKSYLQRNGFMGMRKIGFILVCVISLSACDPMSLMPGAQQKFADQGFKTMIALVELHRIRTGAYPNELTEIRFTGDWDPIYQQFVTYKKLDKGYKLDVKDQKLAKSMVYPRDFWSGLGLAATNVQGYRVDKHELTSESTNGK